MKVTEPLSLGTQRAFVNHLLKREEGWKEKFKLLHKEVIKLKNTIDEHNASLSGIIRPKVFCSSVGVQANLSNSLEVFHLLFNKNLIFVRNLNHNISIFLMYLI